MREIKFEVLLNDTKEIVGWERIGERGQWEHIRPKRDTWLLGAITDGQEYSKFERRQFTGLKDTYCTEEYPNGKEIYQGDIVMSECFKRFPDGSAQLRKYINVIDWYEGVKISGWRIKGKGFQTTLKKSTIGNMKLVVIGNVFQNPELL